MQKMNWVELSAIAILAVIFFIGISIGSINEFQRGEKFICAKLTEMPLECYSRGVK